MDVGNRYGSLSKIALSNTQENKKICAHNYSRTAVYFERFSVDLVYINVEYI